MRVTIISDASWCPNTRAAGYGFWSVSERGRHAGGGSFKAGAKSAMHAEMMAIVNALHVTLALGIAAKGDRVLIQTDCLYGIYTFEGRGLMGKKARKRNAFLSPVVDLFKEHVRANDLTVEFRHVRGHTSVADQRSMAQRHADARARVGMKKARAARRDVQLPKEHTA